LQYFRFAFDPRVCSARPTDCRSRLRKELAFFSRSRTRTRSGYFWSEHEWLFSTVVFRS